ncbi:MAG: DUF3842 family protein [Clostridia bacterium]|nr:DUF3842 family protein [Clostridia bacterium]
MKVVIMDAQGGGVGRMFVEQMKKALPQQPLIAIGTNAAATAAMRKAGADQAATGENAVCVTAAAADLILAPIGMLIANAMLGEVTPRMAAAVGSARAHKILIPATRCGAQIVGVADLPLADYITLAAQSAVQYIQERDS